MTTFKHKAAALTLTAASFTGLGAGAIASAAPSSASTAYWYGHKSASHYASRAQCLANYHGFINHIKSSGRVYKGDTTSNGSTCSTSGYGAIWYTSTHGKLDRSDIGPFRSYAQMYGWIFDYG